MENESIENTKENEDFISDEKKQNQPINPDVPAKQEYSCLTGGIIALLSFFGPWVSCSGETASGAKLGNEFWLVFSAAALIILTFILFVVVIKDKLKYFIYAQISYIVLSAFGIGYLLYKYFKIKDGDFGSMIEIKWGAYITFIGFIITFISALMLKKEK